MKQILKSKIYNFTLMELLLVIAIIVILSSMFIPALNKAREKSRSITCVGNQRQLGLAIMSYCSDYNDFFPDITLVWHRSINPYVKKNGTYASWSIDCSPIYKCLSDPHPYGGLLSYGFNINLYGVRFSKVKSTVLMTGDGGDDTLSGGEPIYGSSQFEMRHSLGDNILLLDGHVEWKKRIQSRVENRAFWNYTGL